MPPATLAPKWFARWPTAVPTFGLWFAAARQSIETVGGDLDEPRSLAAALTGVSAMFLLPGYRDMPGILAEARRAGVGRVVLLSGASAENGDVENAVSRYMIRSEEAVRGSGLTWTILRPSGFMSNALRWLPQLRAGDVVRVRFPDVRVAVIDPFDIAAVAALALTSDGHREVRRRCCRPNKWRYWPPSSTARCGSRGFVGR